MQDNSFPFFTVAAKRCIVIFSVILCRIFIVTLLLGRYI